MLTQFFADAGNTTTTETDIYNYSLPANTLDVNGQKIEAKYGGTFVNSTSTKQLKVKFDGTTIFDSGALTISASSSWDMEVTGIRVSATVIRFTVKMNTSGASLSSYAQYTSVTVANFTSTRILKLTGQAAGVGAATNDIVARLGQVEFMSSN